ncbi:MAG: RIP metalloprotease RseP [Spirochaetia bacterium]|nr:RIP metalloprotease RseP [Spirochaetia bacterium]
MSILWGIIGLGFLVFFHETGHFIAARIFGVKVNAFSIGMGPVLLHKTIKGTDYRISLIPLGGYCSMNGEKDFQKAIEENLETIPAEKDSFYGIHPLKRLLIAFAGPFANYLFSFLAFTVIALIGYTYYSAGTRITLSSTISCAREAGIQDYDEIVCLDSTKVTDFSEIASYIATKPDQDIVFEVLRNGETKLITVHTMLDKETGAGLVGIVSDPSSRCKREYPKHSLVGSLSEGFLKSNEMALTALKSFRILFKGVKLTKALSGPARITSMLGDTVSSSFKTGMHEGIVATLEFLSLISISLFLTNLLPIPVLDGGLILVALVEWIIRKKIKAKILYYIQLIGLTLVISIGAFAIFGDILYFIR